MSRQGYDPSNFLVFDDSALLALYSQAVAAIGLAGPLYLFILQEALGGLENTLVYGLRTTAAASAFLLLVHFAAGNAVVVAPRLPRERAPQAPAHAQHALSLLFTTYQMHFAEAVALAYLFPARFWAQPPALTGLMAASYAAVFILARRWGALRCTWTLAGATKALAARPGEARGGVARACRYFLALSFFAIYVWRAIAYARQGHPFSHATVGALAYAGGLIHAFVSWRQRRQRDAELAGGGVVPCGKDE